MQDPGGFIENTHRLEKSCICPSSCCKFCKVLSIDKIYRERSGRELKPCWLISPGCWAQQFPIHKQEIKQDLHLEGNGEAERKEWNIRCPKEKLWQGLLFGFLAKEEGGSQGWYPLFQAMLLIKYWKGFLVAWKLLSGWKWSLKLTWGQVSAGAISLWLNRADRTEAKNSFVIFSIKVLLKHCFGLSSIYSDLWDSSGRRGDAMGIFQLSAVHGQEPPGLWGLVPCFLHLYTQACLPQLN